MDYDRGLAGRVRELLEEEWGFDEKKMFGGIIKENNHAQDQ